MKSIAELFIAKIDRYMMKREIAGSYFGKISCGNARAIDRIRAGGATIDTLDMVMKYIKLNPASGKKKKQAKDAAE